MSLGDRFVNLFASPGELFQNVRTSPPTHTNWILPLVLLVVVTIAMTQVLLHNPSLVDQLTTMMRDGMKKGVEQAIRDGKITEEQAEAQFEMFRPGSMLFLISSTVGPILWSLVRLFALGLLFWLVGRSAMNAAGTPYMKVVEVVGLTLLISALESIVTTMLMVGLDSIHATPSLALAVSGFDPMNTVHAALAKVNVFTLWILAVLSIGLARLFQRDFPKVAVLVFALWFLWSAVSVFTGMRFGG
jgi:hypothetical protein